MQGVRRPYTNALTDPVLFAGPNAQGADMNALARAQAMETSGADRNDVWRQTGWFKDRDGWSYEVSTPGGPQFRRPELSKQQTSVPLSAVSRDPAVEAAYQGLGNTPVVNGSALLGSDNAAMYMPQQGRPSPYVGVDPQSMRSPRANYFM